MSLSTITLDSLTYEDLRRLGQQQAPIASGGRWTHHAAVDPGITLLELFAFLLDQQLFVMDQLSPDMQLAMMALLGDAPRPAGVARTVVAAPEGSLSLPVSRQAGDVLLPAGGGPAALAFSLAEDLLLLPVAAIAVSVAGTDRTIDMQQGRPVRLFTREESDAPELALTALLSTAIPAALIGRTLAVALLLDGPVPPEWDERAAEVPPPVDLELWLGETRAAPGWRDGTGGLRRSGLIRFAVPADWAGRRDIRIALSAGERRHAEPPVLSRVAVGAAVATHARPVRIAANDTGDAAHNALRKQVADQVASWLPLSNRELALPGELYPVIEGSIRLSLQDRAREWHEWERVDSLAAKDGEARAYVFDREHSRLTFGDGYAGRVPAPAGNVAIDLEVGGGAAGNHPPGLAWRFATGNGPDLISLAAGTGGSEAETLAAAQRRIASAFDVVTRAVTADDHRDLIETARGVAPHRASIAPGFDPAFPCAYVPDSVTVFVVPASGEDTPAPRADEGSLALFRAILDEARLLTTRVFVEPATIRPAALRIEIEGLPVLAPELKDRLHRRLARYLHPALGGANEDGWPFGHPLRPSELMRVAGDLLPQGARVASVAIKLLDAPGQAENACSDTPIGAHELVWLASFQATARAATPTESVL